MDTEEIHSLLEGKEERVLKGESQERQQGREKGRIDGDKM